MEFVYMQQPCPANVTGVPIQLSVTDSNGNFRTIGMATSDGSGTFTYTWTPDISGVSTVTANFQGSESYYPSSAQAYFYAAESAPTTSPGATPMPSMADLYLIRSIIAIIVVIIIVGAIAILMLRRRLVNLRCK